jgi:hypothetical protein
VTRPSLKTSENKFAHATGGQQRRLHLCPAFAHRPFRIKARSGSHRCMSSARRASGDGFAMYTHRGWSHSNGQIAEVVRSATIPIHRSSDTKDATLNIQRLMRSPHSWS